MSLLSLYAHGLAPHPIHLFSFSSKMENYTRPQWLTSLPSMQLFTEVLETDQPYGLSSMIQNGWKVKKQKNKGERVDKCLEGHLGHKGPD